MAQEGWRKHKRARGQKGPRGELSLTYTPIDHIGTPDKREDMMGTEMGGMVVAAGIVAGSGIVGVVAASSPLSSISLTGQHFRSGTPQPRVARIHSLMVMMRQYDRHEQ